MVDLSLIRRINWNGSASIAVPSAAGNRAPSADLFMRRRKAARTQHRVHVTRLLWLLLRGASGRVNMLTRRLGPRDLVFATASAVSLETVSSAIRQASLLKLSGGERAAVAVAPFALIILSSCFPPSTIDTLAFCPKGHQHKQQPGRDGRGSMIGWAGKKNPEPLKVVSVLSFFPVLPNFTLCKICKIRQVVFTTCLNWLLKPLLKRICTEGRNLT